MAGIIIAVYGIIMVLWDWQVTGSLWSPEVHVWSCDIQPKNHGLAVVRDMSLPEKLYERCTPASAMDQLWIDCSSSVL